MRRSRELLRLLPKAGRCTLLVLVVLAVAEPVISLAIIATIGLLVSRVAAAPLLAIISGPLVLLASLFAAQQVVALLRGVATYRATRRIDSSIRTRAMEAANGPVGVEYLEDPLVQDRIIMASGKPSAFRSATPGDAAVALIGIAARYAGTLGAAFLIARFSVLLAFALFSSTLILRDRSHRELRARALAFDEHLPRYRIAGYATGLAVEPAAAKEARIFGLADWLLARHAGAWRTVTASMSSIRHRTSWRLVRYQLLALPLQAAVFIAVGLAAIDGRVDEETLVIVLQASIHLISLAGMGSEEYKLDFGSASLLALRHVEESRAADPQLPVPAATAKAESLPTADICFQGVSFSYPGSGLLLFENLDLVVPAGSSLAIVGTNGAGKTTLVKLLARLYRPSAGRITVDGHDIAELAVDAWRRRLAIIFQDFVHYEMPVFDNIGFGAIERLGDTQALKAAASRAGIAQLIEALPDAWSSVLGRGYRDSVELSGGEWQRIALARALFAVEGGAQVLVLDEPTANLDVRSEVQLFDRMLEVTAGLTTLLISHRFSTVRRAERICVLDGGRVAEQGTHDELMARGGHYAKMFRLQASQFHD